MGPFLCFTFFHALERKGFREEITEGTDLWPLILAIYFTIHKNLLNLSEHMVQIIATQESSKVLGRSESMFRAERLPLSFLYSLTSRTMILGLGKFCVFRAGRGALDITILPFLLVLIMLSLVCRLVLFLACFPLFLFLCLCTT